jgi:hypothetical protein
VVWTTAETDLTFAIDMGLSGKYAQSTLHATYNGAALADSIVAPEDVAAGTYAFRIGIPAIVGGTSRQLGNGLYTFYLTSMAGTTSQAINEGSVLARLLEINVALMDIDAPAFTVRTRGFTAGAWTASDDAAFIITPAATLPSSGIKYQVKIGAADWRDITPQELAWMQDHDGDFPIVRNAEMLDTGMGDLLGAAAGFDGTVRFRAYKQSQAGAIDNAKDEYYDAEHPNNPYYPAQFQDGAGIDVRIDRFTPILTVADNHTWWTTGTYNLDFAITFGTVNASSALNTITQIHNGVQTAVARPSYSNGSFTAAVTQNGDYTFIARSQSGMETTFVLEGDAPVAGVSNPAVKWVDRDVAPQSPIVAMYVYDASNNAVQTTYSAGKWYNTNVEFRLNVSASVIPTSGVYYQYRIQTKDKAADAYGAWSNVAAQYGDWINIPNTGDDESPLYSVIFGADDVNGMKNIEFRVFAGRLYTPGTYVEGISDPANVDDGILGDTITPVAREIGIDKTMKYNVNKDSSEQHTSGVAPDLADGVYGSATVNPKGWVNTQNYAFKFTWPAMAYAQAVLAVRLGSENGTVLGAYNNLDSGIVEITISENADLWFVLTYETGETTAYNFNARFIDNAPVDYTISPSGNVSATVWTNSDATFFFDFGSGNRDSYAFFMYKGGSTWSEITSAVISGTDGSGIYTFGDGDLTNGGFDGNVEFFVYKKYAAPANYLSADPGLQPTNSVRAFALRVDKATPTVTVTNNPSAWQTSASYTLNFTVNAGLSWGAGVGGAASKIVVERDGSQLTGVPTATQGVSSYAYDISRNGLYRITAYNSTPTYSGAFVYVSGYAEFTVNRMDNAEITAKVIPDPSALTAADNGVWYNGSAVFTVNHNIDASAGGSGLAFYSSYDGAAWTCFYTVGGNGVAIDGSQYFTRSTDYSGAVYFRAARIGDGSIANGETSNSLTDANSALVNSFWLNLDNAAPTVTLADTTVYTNGWTTGNATIEVTVVTGISGSAGNVTVYYRNGGTVGTFQPIQVSSGSATAGDGNNGAAVGQYIYKTNITVTPSDIPVSGTVTYTVYAVANTGLTSDRGSDKTIDIDQIDTTPNTAINVNVAALNADRWQQESVTFVLSV